MLIYRCDICGKETRETNPKLSDFMYEYDNKNRHICNLCADKVYSFLTLESEDVEDIIKEKICNFLK